MTLRFSSTLSTTNFEKQRKKEKQSKSFSFTKMISLQLQLIVGYFNKSTTH